MIDNFDAALRALQDPRTDGATLAAITQAFPQLGPHAAAHPNAYPELVAWVAQYADALAQERAAFLAATPPTAAPVTASPAASPATTATPAATPVVAATAPTATTAPARRRRLLVPILASVAALALVAAGLTTAFAVNRMNEAQSTAAQAADSADRAADPASASGTRSGTAPDSTKPGDPATPRSSAPKNGSSAAPVAGTSQSGSAPVVLILDASGSMVRETTKGRTRMDDARDAMLAALDMLPDDAEVALLVFGTGTGNSDAEQAQGCTDVKTVSPLGKIDRKALGASVRGIKQSGYTPIGPSLRTAAGLLPKDGPGTIVLVSDGVDTCSPPPACEVASELHGQNGALTIHAVGFAVDQDEQAQKQLECVGRVGGGSYLPANNVSQLSSRIATAVNGTDTEKVLAPDGFQGVRLGMTQDEVRARSTTFTVTDRKTIEGVEVIYVDCGWGTLEFRGGLVFAIRPSPEAPTLDGVAVGDKISRATEVYGEPVSRGKDDLGSYVVFAVSTGSPYGYAVYGSGKIKRIVLCRCTGIEASASLADWDITFAGVGPLRLGMTAKEMLAALPGAAADVTGSDAKPVEVQPLPAVKELQVTFWQGKIAAIAVGDRYTSAGSEEELRAAGARLPNLRGIRLGDTKETVRNIMPQGTSVRIVAAGVADYTIATREGATIAFQGIGDRNSTQGSAQYLRGFEVADSTKIEYPFHDPVTVKAPTPTSQPSAKTSIEITEDLAKNLLIPAGSCGSGQGAGWNQTEPIQLQDGSGEAFPAAGRGAGILSSRLVGSADINGDGINDAVVVAQCTGTPKTQCCAGRASILNAVLALDVSGSAPTLIGGSIWASTASVNGRNEALTIDDTKNLVALEGTEIVTYEYPIYDNAMTPDQVANATGWFRHTYSDGDWVRSAS